jgi:VWFA-related protein
MSHRCQPVALAVATLLALTVCDAQQVFRSGVSLVLVDIRVIDKNFRSVADLKPEDVEVLVDGQSRAFTGFEYHGDDLSLLPGVRSASTGDATRPTAGRSSADVGPNVAAGKQARTIVLAVHSTFINLGDGPRAYKGAEAFIEHLRPTDSVSVLPIPSGLDKPLKFTSSHEELKTQLKDAVLHTSGDEWKRAAGPANCTAPAASAASGSSFAMSHACWDAVEGPESEIEAIWRARIMARDLNALFSSLAGIDGPKDVVMVTTDIPIPLGEIALLGEMVRVASNARVRVHSLQMGEASDWVGPESRTSGRPEGLSIPTTKSTTPISSGMLHLATATGGVAMAPMTGMVFFERLERELAGSYVLAFEPLASERDGKPHKITVHLRKRSRLTVRTRESFVLQKEPQQTPATADPPPASRP